MYIAPLAVCSTHCVRFLTVSQKTVGCSDFKEGSVAHRMLGKFIGCYSAATDYSAIRMVCRNMDADTRYSVDTIHWIVSSGYC